MQKERYAKLSAQKFQNVSRRNDGTFERPNFRRDERPCPARREAIATHLGGDDQCSYPGCLEYGPCEIHSAASSYYHLKRRSRLFQNLAPVAQIKAAGSRKNGIGDKQMRRSGLVKCIGSHHDGVCRCPKQAHNEAVRLVETADVATAGLAGDFVANYAINRAGEVTDHIGPSGAAWWEPQIAAVRDSQRFRQNGGPGCFQAVEYRADGVWQWRITGWGARFRGLGNGTERALERLRATTQMHQWEESNHAL